MNPSFKNPQRQRGFTLIELLTVVGIIAVMLSVAAVGIQNIDKGQATISGVSQVQALMEEARSLAIGRATRARLVIHADQSDEDRYLRFAAVAYEKVVLDDDGEVTDRIWQVDSRGTSLPNGVYFHPGLARTAGSQVNGLGEFGEKDDANITFPGEGVRNPNYYFWEFNSEGLCVGDGSGNPGAPFVLCRGVITPNSPEPRVIGNDVAGFIVWRNGRTSAIRDTESISQSTTD